MKKILLAAIIATFVGDNNNVAAKNITGNRTYIMSNYSSSLYGGSGDDEFSEVILTSDGGTLAVGYTSSIGTGDFVDLGTAKSDKDGLVVKYDPLGNIEWRKVYGGADDDYFTGAIEHFGRYELIGFSNSESIEGAVNPQYASRGNTFTAGIQISISLNGNHENTTFQSYVGREDTSLIDRINFTDVVATTDGKRLAYISNYRNTASGFTGTSIGIDATTLTWKHNETNEIYIRNGVVLGTDLLLLSGYTNNIEHYSGTGNLTNNGGRDGIVQKYTVYNTQIGGYDVLGFGGSGDDDIIDSVVTDGGDLIIVGTTTSDVSGDITTTKIGVQDVFIASIDIGHSSINWQKRIGTTGTTNVTSIVKGNDSNYYISGTFSEKTNDFANMDGLIGESASYVAEIGIDGSMIGMATISGSGNDEIKDMVVSEDGKITAVGYTTSSNSGNINGTNNGGKDLFRADFNLLWVEHPVITLPYENNTVRIKQYRDFDPLTGVTAFDNDGQVLAENIRISSDILGTNNTIDTSQVGEFAINYTVTDRYNISTSERLTVIVEEDLKPIISSQNNVYYVNMNDNFDPLAVIEATDAEEGDLIDDVVVSGMPDDTTIPGIYTIRYNVADSYGNLADEYIITLNIVETFPPKLVLPRDGEKILLSNINSFDPMAGVSATDKEDDDASLIIMSDYIKPETIGEYSITYSVTDSDGNTVIETRKIIIVQKPVINTPGYTVITEGDPFNPLQGVSATDENGNLVSEINVSGKVDNFKSGTYELTYWITDENGSTTSVNRTIVVTEKPVIIGADDRSINPDWTFDPMAGVSATDKEDNNSNLEVTIIGGTGMNTDWKTPGEYTLIYSVTDSDNNTTTVTRTIIVKSRNFWIHPYVLLLIMTLMWCFTMSRVTNRNRN